MLNDHEKRRIAGAIREHLARAHMSREEFAFRTKLGKSTVDKLLTGLFSVRTLSIVEDAMSVRFRNFELVEERADQSLGGYSRSDLSVYEGEYVFIRPSFKAERTIFAFAATIGWDDDPAGLALRIGGDAGQIQAGSIFVPKVSFHIFVYSSDASCTRHLILSRMDGSMRLRGLMLTLANTFANAYAPVSSPVVLVKKQSTEEALLGRIEAEHPLYAEYRHELRSVETAGHASQIRASEL